MAVMSQLGRSVCRLCVPRCSASINPNYAWAASTTQLMIIDRILGMFIVKYHLNNNLKSESEGEVDLTLMVSVGFIEETTRVHNVLRKWFYNKASNLSPQPREELDDEEADNELSQEGHPDKLELAWNQQRRLRGQLDDTGGQRPRHLKTRNKGAIKMIETFVPCVDHMWNTFCEASSLWRSWLNLGGTPIAVEWLQNSRFAAKKIVSEEWKTRDRIQQIDCTQGGEMMDKRGGEMEKWEVEGQSTCGSLPHWFASQLPLACKHPPELNSTNPTGNESVSLKRRTRELETHQEQRPKKAVSCISDLLPDVDPGSDCQGDHPEFYHKC
ncbi:hypothetical protein B0H14DRAFT_2589469 [Mycena olivaceomarginata]|nr:hypothetical protein B0H14DRAFT_2589469 [Mycena olivaceomarginata]